MEVITIGLDHIYALVELETVVRKKKQWDRNRTMGRCVLQFVLCLHRMGGVSL